MLLTKDAAEKYFGDSKVINKTLIIGEDKRTYTVKGILDKIPENSHLQFSMLASLSSFPYLIERPDWGGNFNFLTYIVLKENTDIQLFEDKYSMCIRKHWAPLPEKYMGITLEEFEKQGKYFRHWLQPLDKIHLHSKSSDDTTNKGNVQLLLILGITGLLIIIIACVNFINLNIARSNKRSKEIGIKKIFGSNHKQLITGFLFESFLHCFIALLLSVNFLILLFPVLNNYTGLSLSATNLLNYRILIVLVILLVILTFMSGGYLAFGISKLKAIDMMKEIISGTFKTLWWNFQDWWNRHWKDKAWKPEIIIFGHTHVPEGPVRIKDIEGINRSKITKKLEDTILVNSGSWIKEGIEDNTNFIFINDDGEIHLCSFDVNKKIGVELGNLKEPYSK